MLDWAFLCLWPVFGTHAQSMPIHPSSHRYKMCYQAWSKFCLFSFRDITWPREHPHLFNLNNFISVALSPFYFRQESDLTLHRNLFLRFRGGRTSSIPWCYYDIHQGTKYSGANQHQLEGLYFSDLVMGGILSTGCISHAKFMNRLLD